MAEEGRKPHVKLIAKNRRALFDYHVEDKVEAGIALTGTEVKSLRDGSAQLSDSYAVGQRGELFLLNAQIPPYKPSRKLLLHRREIEKLLDKQQKAGYALIPLSLYFKEGRAKVEIGVCKGKASHDKRDAIAERDAKREIDRARRR
ncbi:MAG: SsrA-binding protein SmpB [Deltaproteobacteria bacterium]|nr:MAG: SsrA-binding protein SmpB [Deltaproteobacteria bacterium]